MPSTRGARERRRTEVSARLLDVARRELARTGAAGLSVRAVAREMGMAPSALFRYISSRDELLTLLIVDAYSRLADHVEAAEAVVPRHDLRGRWRALAAAFREWALRHPHDYALLYGSPVPEYHAPADRTNPAGTRVTDLLVAIGAAAPERPARASIPGLPGPARLEELAQAAGVTQIPAERLASGLLAWTLLVGAISSELFEQLGEALAALDVLFESSVALGEWLLFGSEDSHDEKTG